MDHSFEKCPNTIYIQDLHRRIENLEQEMQAFGVELKEIEKAAIVNQEKTNQIFGMLERIERSISTIADELKEIQGKPARNWNTVITTVITGLTTAGVTYLIATGGR